MRILFVDDEPQVLRGIERMLFHLADEWDLQFAHSGAEAIEMLAADQFDVLVTDMRMPEMDGTEVLMQAVERFPQVVRIVLSGYTELEPLIRAISVSHQYLSKPCGPDVLQSVIERAYELQHLLSDSAVRDTIGRLATLPPVPDIYAQLSRELVNPTVSVENIVDIIKQDPAMTAKILQLANSAFFSHQKKIGDVYQAVSRLGFQIIKNIILSIKVFDPSDIDEARGGFSLRMAQRHALRTASAASRLLTSRQASDDAFLAALLHDIGKLVLAVEMPERLTQIADLAEQAKITAYEAEKRLFKVTHAEIGAYLLSLWGLPYGIIEAVANHHEPLRTARAKDNELVAMLYIANCLDNGHKPDPAIVQAQNLSQKVRRCEALLQTYQDIE